MPNIPPTPPCGSWSAIHAGCAIGVGPDETRSLGPVENAIATPGQLLVTLGGVVYSRPISDFSQDSPDNPAFENPTSPRNPAYFPPTRP